MNCCVSPAVTDGLAGDTVMDANTAPAQVRVVLPLMPPLVAVINEVPVVKHVASPVLLMLAVVNVPDDHVTEVSVVCAFNELVPTAVNCSVSPAATDGLGGDTVTDASTAAVQFSVVLPLTVPLVAVINELPTDKHVATPLPLIVATPLLVFQPTEFNVCGEPEE